MVDGGLPPFAPGQLDLGEERFSLRCLSPVGTVVGRRRIDEVIVCLTRFVRGGVFSVAHKVARFPKVVAYHGCCLGQGVALVVSGIPARLAAVMLAAVVVAAEGRLIHARHHGGTGRRTHGARNKGVLKADAFHGQLVDVGGLDGRFAVTSEVGRRILGYDPEDVGLGSLGVARGGGHGHDAQGRGGIPQKLSTFH